MVVRNHRFLGSVCAFLKTKSAVRSRALLEHYTRIGLSTVPAYPFYGTSSSAEAFDIQRARSGQ